MSTRMRCVSVIALTAIYAYPATAQKAGDEWVRQRVVAKGQNPLMVGTLVVDDGSRHRIYTVEKSDGDRLWLVSPGSPSGWMHSSKVVPCDDAIAHFTAAIRDNPDSPQIGRCLERQRGI